MINNRLDLCLRWDYEIRINIVEIIINNGKNHSGAFDLNYLAVDKNIYIMDNHLAAIWCWVRKINTTGKYNFFHLDQHDDCLTSHLTTWLHEIKSRKINLSKMSIQEMVELKYNSKLSPNGQFQLFQWSNYIPIFFNLFPKLIDEAIFATHNTRPMHKIANENSLVEKEIFDVVNNLNYWISENSKRKWIFDLDIDFFFTKHDEQRIQFLSDEYVLAVAEEIKKSLKSIEILTIALSPECCGGWDNAIRVAKIITDCLNVS